MNPIRTLAASAAVLAFTASAALAEPIILDCSAGGNGFGDRLLKVDPVAKTWMEWSTEREGWHLVCWSGDRPRTPDIVTYSPGITCLFSPAQFRFDNNIEPYSERDIIQIDRRTGRWTHDRGSFRMFQGQCSPAAEPVRSETQF